MTLSSDEGDNVVTIHPLPWRSKYVDSMFEKLDKYTTAKKTPQAQRQMKQRVVGACSQRTRPTIGDIPEWAVQAK